MQAQYQALAVLSTGIYFTGLTFLKIAMFLAGTGLLIVLAVPVMGERLTLREWGCVVVLAAATALFADASAGGPHIAPPEAAGGATVLTSAAGSPGAGAGTGAGAAVPHHERRPSPARLHRAPTAR